MLLVIGACMFWAMFLRPQSLGGPAGYVLVSGKSMEPLYHTGDMILVGAARELREVGDIIAYRVPKGDAMAGAQVIHRIIGGNATHGFIVQGDNSTAPDVWRPKPGDIVGSAVGARSHRPWSCSSTSARRCSSDCWRPHSSSCTLLGSAVKKERRGDARAQLRRLLA